MRPEPTWVRVQAVLFLHRDQIAQFGGTYGIRDRGMLESALSRAQNSWHYEKTSIVDMAADYAYGIARNHPFVDGNKRTALVASALFLELNGLELVADEVDTAVIFFALASGEVSKKDLSSWFRKFTKVID